VSIALVMLFALNFFGLPCGCLLVAMPLLDNETIVETGADSVEQVSICGIDAAFL
jgi:hypothetical protein